MVKVLIVDSNKASTVMSAEAFKEQISGVKIMTAANGKEGIEMAKDEKPDMCLIDFDLPDADGISMVQTLRQYYKGPILLSVYPDEIATSAIRKELFAFNDSGDFLAKPIASTKLGEKIQHFVTDGRRIGKRFNVAPLNVECTIIAKAEGRGKRAPKFPSCLKTVSLGGASVEVLENCHKVKMRSQVTFSMQLPTVNKNKFVKRGPNKFTEIKLKAKVVWKSKPFIGLEFERLSEVQQLQFENFIRISHETSKD